MPALRPLHALQLAWRGLRRTPGTSLSAVLTLGVSFISVVVLLGVLEGSTRPIPVPGGERVVRIELLDARAERAAFPTVPVRDWVQGPGIAAAGALASVGGTLVRDGVPAIQASGAALEPAVFPLLGIAPARGRWPGANAEDAAAIVLGADVAGELGADVLGAEVRLDGVPHTVVGVMPRGFGFPEKQSFWTVLDARDSVEQVVARLAGGIELPAAQAALDVRARSLPVADGDAGPYRTRVRPWQTGRGEGGEAMAFGGLAVLVAVLVIICAANVSTLLMVRATERAGTLAVHAALGAARAQIALVLFAEALIVALAGGLLGLAGGAAALRWMEVNLSQHWGYYWMRMELEPSMLAGVFSVVLAAALLAGTAPALRASRIDLRDVLAGGGRGGSGSRRRWSGRWFVWVQVSLSTVGLVAALLLAGGVRRLGEFSADLPLDRVAVGGITPGARYQEAAARTELLARMRQELLRIPGARAVTLGTGIPGMDHSRAPLQLLGDTVQADAPRTAGWLAADEGMLETFGLRLLRGRNLGAGDVANAAPVALVTASFAERHLAGVDPIGARVRLEGVHAAGAWAEVVGVIADWSADDARGGSERVLLPIHQVTAPSLRIAVLADDPESVVAALRGAVSRVDPELAVETPQTLRALVAWLLRMPRVLAGFGVIGGITGVLVAAIGLYGVIAFQVRRRLAEIGVRIALGARARHVLRDILLEALVRVAPGVVVGGTLAYAGVSALGFLVGERPRSPVVFGAAVLIMFAVAVVASLAPAVRAARLDPLVIMRRE